MYGLDGATPLRILKKRPLSYAQLANRAGFKARSFPRAVITGEKSLSISSAEAVARALSMSIDLKDYFVSMVHSEEASLEGEREAAEIYLIRARKKLELSTKSKREQNPFSPESAQRIFDAIDGRELGSSVSDILRRSKLPTGQGLSFLNSLASLGYLKREGLNFSKASLAPPPFKDSNGETEFLKHFQKKLTKAWNASAMLSQSSEICLFHESTFTANRARLHELRNELSWLLSSFVEEGVSIEGEETVSLTCAFFPERGNGHAVDPKTEA